MVCVDHTRTGIEAGIYPVGTKNSLAKAVDRRGSDFSDAWRCRIEVRRARLCLAAARQSRRARAVVRP